MELAQRIASLLEGEHEALRAAIVAADAALFELEQGRRAWHEPERIRTPHPAERNWEPLSRTPGPAPPRARNAVALRRAWGAFRTRLDRHMRLEREIVLPLCLTVARGDGRHRVALRTAITQTNGDHDELRLLLAELRRAGRAVYPVRNEIERVARLFEAHTRAEEVEIYPAFFVERGVGAVTPPPASTRTSDDVTKALRRRSPPPPPEPEPEPEPGVLGQLLRMLGR